MNSETINKANTISAVLVVYNEEKRIRYILESLQWCDEVVVIDKYSTDRTVEIAKQYPKVRISYVENPKAFSDSETVAVMNACKMKYSILATASDVIHPSLAKEIKRLLQEESFDYDGIRVPYRGYFLGMYEKYSPWYATSSIKVIKTSCLKMQEGYVHSAIVSDVKSVYQIALDDPTVAYYHLTHESADGIITRHTRYWRGEASSPDSLSASLKSVYNALKIVIKRGAFFKGKAALALAFSFLSYYMMTYVYKWDYQCGKGEEIYDSIRKDMMQKWLSYTK